jgi:ribosome recycling factor
MPIPEVMRDVQHRMHGAIEALHAHFKTLRTGRANAAMLDGVTVDYYGTPTPIGQAASIKVPEAALLVLEPWDKSMVGAIEKAIRNADLGLNPASDGKVIRVPVPMLTEERRKDLVKKAHAMAEESRTAIRQVPPRRQRQDQEAAQRQEHLRGRREARRSGDPEAHRQTHRRGGLGPEAQGTGHHGGVRPRLRVPRIEN